MQIKSITVEQMANRSNVTGINYRLRTVHCSTQQIPSFCPK